MMKTIAMVEACPCKYKCSDSGKSYKVHIYQQNAKSTEVYNRKSWKRSPRIVVTVEKKEFRQCDYSNHRVFTLRCISKGLVPVIVRLNSKRKDISIGARNII